MLPYSVHIPYISKGFEFTLRVDELSLTFFLLTAVLFIPVAVYAIASIKDKKWSGLGFLLISLFMAIGAIFSDSLGIMLFFGEGLFCTLAVFLLKSKVFTKALTLSGFANLLLMFGIMVAEHAAETGSISEFTRLSLSGSGLLGFLCMTLGAAGLMGFLPFHSWIPEAAEEAPTFFSAAFNGLFLRVFGGLFLIRIFTTLFTVEPFGTVSILLMVFGALIVLLATLAALTQQNLKSLVSYIAISQAGLSIIGFSSGTLYGIAGGTYSVINQTVLITGLFLVCGMFEKRLGTTDLKNLRGIAKKQPVAAAFFAALTLSALVYPLFHLIVGMDGLVLPIVLCLATWISVAGLVKACRAFYFGVPGKQSNKRKSFAFADPYKGFLAAVGGFSDLCVRMEHGVSWVYDRGIPGLVTGIGQGLHTFNNGRLSRYLSLVVAGMVLLAAIFLVIL